MVMVGHAELRPESPRPMDSPCTKFFWVNRYGGTASFRRCTIFRSFLSCWHRRPQENDHDITGTEAAGIYVLLAQAILLANFIDGEAQRSSDVSAFD